MRRRDANAVSGWVKFPTDQLENTGEGGTFVRLVVLPNEYLHETQEVEAFMQCCGGMNTILYDESLLEDDETANVPHPPSPGEAAEQADLVAWFEAEQARGKLSTVRHFPHFDDETASALETCVSAPYLAVLTIGSTGWTSSEWTCRYDDLTDEGKALYDSISTLYAGTGKVLLQTWLDT